MAMVPGGFHLIKNLCGRRENWRLMVKLVRFWNMCSVATPNDPYALQMLFMDEEGERIEATVQRPLMNKFRHALLMGNCGKFRAASHEFKLMFNATTNLIPCQSAKIRHVGIQNVMNASKIFWNPEWPVAIEFKNSLPVHEVETDVCIGTISDRGRPVCLREEFLKLYPKKSVRQLVESVEEGSFVVLGTIAEIIEESTWWYMASTCMKAVSYEPGFPYYEDCKTVVFELTPKWYKLKVIVSDGFESAQLIMFDSECFTLLSKPCREMVLISQAKGLSCGEFPTEIKELIGKEFLFRVENKDESLFGLDDSFKVKRACSESFIIDEFKEALDDETPLKLKFAPPFTNMGNIDANRCRTDLISDINVVATVLDVSPISIGQSSSTTGQSSSSPEDAVEASKRELESSVDPSSDRMKRAKRRVVKNEKQ
ncbi:hypothetical protein SESBI_01233 [Sesbania bispinosa]|nr:hypothetical protein SESBI_01233 [Sesbania bispinosa]